MRGVLFAMIFCLLFGKVGTGQDAPRSVSLIELLATPERLAGNLVTIKAFFLALTGRHDISAYFLCLSKEDAENELGNSVLVIPNQEMLAKREKFDRMYVSVTGTVEIVRGADGTSVAVIKNVTECRLWSDPVRPILFKRAGPGKLK